VFVSVIPQKYFVEKVACGHFEVRAFTGPNQDPHHFTPSADQMKALSSASVFFTIGAEFEEVLIQKIKKMMPKLILVDMRGNIELENQPKEGTHHHPARAQEDYSHEWLSPVLVSRMTGVIAKTLGRLDTGRSGQYDSAAIVFQGELATLNRSLHAILKPFRGSRMFVFHPAFGFFAREYGLIQVAVESHGKEPGAKTLARLTEEIKRQQAKTIFVQPQFSRKSAEAIARQAGCAVMLLSPLPENYLTDMRKLAETIRQGLSKGETGG
jgi:zinc transport system substrate-binding protein